MSTLLRPIPPLVMSSSPSRRELLRTLRTTCTELHVLAAALEKRTQDAPAETARASARRIRRVIESLEEREAISRESSPASA